MNCIYNIYIHKLTDCTIQLSTIYDYNNAYVQLDTLDFTASNK